MTPANESGARRVSMPNSIYGTSYCHGDHSCSAGQHLDGHDTCHANHTCSTGFDVVNHDECKWVGCPSGQHAHSVMGTGSCHGDHPACTSGEHRHSHDDACHADHSCATGFDVVNHDECKWVGCPSGQHAHSVMGTGSCHGDHPACTSGEHRHSHDDACHADHSCATGFDVCES